VRTPQGHQTAGAHRAKHRRGPLIPSQPVYFAGDALFTPLAYRTGIPIGNLASQFFANRYLDDFDHWVKETLRCPAYLRYVDDAVLLGDEKDLMAAWREAIRARLAEERLLLHPGKAHIYTTRRGVSLLGNTVFPDFRRLRSDNGHRFRRRLQGFAHAYAQGCAGWRDFQPRIQAWVGHACKADTLGLRRRLFVTKYTGLSCAVPPHGSILAPFKRAVKAEPGDSVRDSRPATWLVGALQQDGSGLRWISAFHLAESVAGGGEAADCPPGLRGAIKNLSFPL
jgi:hypothetical protein